MNSKKSPKANVWTSSSSSLFLKTKNSSLPHRKHWNKKKIEIHCHFANNSGNFTSNLEKKFQISHNFGLLPNLFENSCSIVNWNFNKKIHDFFRLRNIKILWILQTKTSHITEKCNENGTIFQKNFKNLREGILWLFFHQSINFLFSLSLVSKIKKFQSQIKILWNGENCWYL